MIVIAVEDAALLLAVNRVAGGVEVEDQLLGSLRMRGDEALDHGHMRRPRSGAIRRPLKAPHRRGTGEPSIAPDRRLPRQVVAQTFMVVNVFVAQRNSVHPLAQQRQKFVRGLASLARVVESTRQARQQVEPAVRRSRKLRPAVRRDIAASEIRLNPTPTTPWKFDLRKAAIRYAVPLRSIQSKHLNHNAEQGTAVTLS